jgi:methylmalonyl-CoA mutase C-terminal domain/subunit
MDKKGGKNKIRVLLAKPGLDGHNRGVQVVARALRDAGMEVIYTGIRATSDDIVKAALEEDVDVVGLSCLSGAHIPLFPDAAKKLREEGGKNILLICGGIISAADAVLLKEAGFAGVFTPGSSTDDIVKLIRDRIKK